MEENKDVPIEKNEDGQPAEEFEIENAEVNTFDPIPLGTVSNEKSDRSHGTFFKSIYSFAAFLTVFLTIIFASAEVGDFIINNVGTGNFIMKRIFGSEIANGDHKNLCDIIIKNMFIVPSRTDNDHPPSESEKNEGIDPPYPETDYNAPKDTESEAPSVLPETSPPDTDPPETDASPDTKYPIIQMDMSLLSYGENYIYNNTDLSPDIKKLSSVKLERYSPSGAPLVLIIHTHGTESYMSEGSKFYADSEEIARSKDKTQNMIAVGREFVAVLEASGIPTLHCEIMHDEESYRESYSRAADTIKKYLDEYPSIKYVFDIHRDSIMRPSGELISAVTSINGNECAQIMPVVGSGFEGWENNMVFALQLRSKLNTAYTNLCRPACLRSSTYNQDLSAISLILEIGTSGNDLPEAKEAARLTAEIITEMILGQ